MEEMEEGKDIAMDLVASRDHLMGNVVLDGPHCHSKAVEL